MLTVPGDLPPWFGVCCGPDSQQPCQQPPLHFIQTPFPRTQEIPLWAGGCSYPETPRRRLLYREMSVVCNGDSHPLSKSHRALAGGASGGPACPCSPAPNSWANPGHWPHTALRTWTIPWGEPVQAAAPVGMVSPATSTPGQAEVTERPAALALPFFLPTLKRISLWGETSPALHLFKAAVLIMRQRCHAGRASRCSPFSQTGFTLALQHLPPNALGHCSTGGGLGPLASPAHADGLPNHVCSNLPLQGSLLAQAAD